MKMGQQFSNAAESAAAERRVRAESCEVGRGHPSSAWRNNATAAVTSGHGELTTGVHSVHKPRIETEVSRMSIRAAIDTFIENCLSTPTDDKVVDTSPTVSSVGGGNKTILDSSASTNSNSSTGDTDGTHSDAAGSEDSCKGHIRDMKDADIDTKDKELVVDCEEKMSVESKGKDETDKLKDTICDSGPDIQREEVNDCRDGKVNTHKESVKDLSVETSNGTSEKQSKVNVGSEKQSFSDFLQNQLKRIDYDKHEELAQLALSKDIQCQGQMIMWEVAKKPVTSSDSAAGSLFTSGPVRLQTLIDKVLDNSLSNQSPTSITNCNTKSRESGAVQQVGDSTHAHSVPTETNLKEQQKWNSSTEKNMFAPKDKRLCFKDHIEKVLLESFLSYEEDERRETLKNEGKSNGQHVETSSDTQNTKKDGTISVQDIVDQVISQTEMISKLLTPSAKDVSKSTTSYDLSDKSMTSSDTFIQSNPGLKHPNISPQSRALIEAQRHTVQKEHQSSTSLGRKRGRPHLNSTSSSISCPPEPVKDLKSVHYNDRVQDVKGGQMSSHTNNHPNTGPPPQNYASQSSHQYGVPTSITSLMSSQITSPSSKVMLQNRHHIAQKSAEAFSTVRASLPPTTTPSYHFHPHDSFHQQHEGQHMSSQAQHHPHHSSSYHGGPMFSSHAPPPLILADQVKDSMTSGNHSSQFIPVSHIPTNSCSCHSCLMYFSRGQSHSTHPQQRSHHQLTEQDRTSDPSIHPSSCNTYQVASPHRNSKDVYLQSVSALSDAITPVLTVSVQDLPPTFLTIQKQRLDSGLVSASREVTTDRELRSISSSGHYQPCQDKIPGVVKSASLDPRFPDTLCQVPRHNKVQFDYSGSEVDSCTRLTRDSAPYPDIVEESKTGVMTLFTQADQAAEQPLDLSVKPGPTTRKDSRTDMPRQDIMVHDKTSLYRQPFLDLPSRNKGQYVENGQLGPSGHHLQRLENSVDKLLLHGHPQSQPHMPHYIHHTYLPLPGTKMSLLPTPHGAQPDGRGQSDLDRSGSQTLLREPHDPRASLHSPIIHTQVIPDFLPSQQQPVLQQPQHPRNTAPSPGVRYYQSKSPGLGQCPVICEGQPFPVRLSSSPAGHQRPPSLGPEQNRATPIMSPACVSTPAHPQNSPSPEDQDGQKLGISKHEPIQNIIGNHSPSDILYLICRLCRQTYGSPYGFRKHFRNQHGFEPKADHTIVQTISATKTAMVHTGPLDTTEESLLSQSPKEEKPLCNDVYMHSQSSIIHPGASCTSQSSSNLALPEDIKPELKKEVSENTKCLECPECGQTFQLNDFGSYKRHCRQHSIHRSTGPFACHDCQRSFAEPEQLRDHLVTHSSFTPSLCGICRTFFSSPDYLAEHLQAAHGHIHSNEENEKSSSRSDGSESSRSVDHTQKSEHSLLQGIQSNSDGIKRSSSFSGHSLLVSSPSHSSMSSAPGHSSAALGVQESLTRSSSASSVSHNLSVSKHHHFNRFSPGDTHLFTVHTPKGLEVEKLPADGVVTTASPDSSYDEAKFQLDSQPVSSMTQSVNSMSRPGSSLSRPGSCMSRLAEAQITGESDMPKGSKYEQDSKSLIHENKTSGNIFSHPKKEEASDHNICESGDETELDSLNTPVSMDSNSLSVEGSHAPSVGEDEAGNVYKHKKYGRYRKRLSPCHGGNEPETKSQKVEGDNPAHRLSPYSVSSTANFGVTVQDCESSVPNLEDSSLSLNKPRCEEGRTDADKLCGFQKDEQGDPSSDSSKSRSGLSGVAIGDGATEFKWDRQTRSQTGKTSHGVTNTS